jgi:hypothetical protein
MIVLPNAHTGGEFQIRAPFTDDSAFRSLQHNCIYFSRDSPHRVLRVTSGVRATLVFDVYYDRNYARGDKSFEEIFTFDKVACSGEEQEEVTPKPTLTDREASVASAFVQEIQRIYQEHLHYSSIAIQMRHTYLKTITEKSLCGFDRILHKLLQQVLGPKQLIYLVPVIVFGVGDSITIQELGGDFTKTVVPKTSDTLFIPIGSLLMVEQQHAIEFTGNEAQEAQYTCFTCAFVLPIHK